MSKLTGVPAESRNEMMSNEELVKMISSQIYDNPQMSAEMFNGESFPISADDSEVFDSYNEEDAEIGDDKLTVDDLDMLDGSSDGQDNAIDVSYTDSSNISAE